MRSKGNGLVISGSMILIVSLLVFVWSFIKKAEMERAYMLNGDMHYKGAQLINIISMLVFALGLVLLLSGLMRKRR